MTRKSAATGKPNDADAQARELQSHNRADRGQLLVDVLAALDTRVGELRQAEPLLRAFAAWLGVFGGDGASILHDAAHVAATHDGAGRQYQDVAVMGFAGSRLPRPEKGQADPIAERFRAGIEWMRGRRFFVPNQPLSFEADGIALLGTATGIMTMSAPARRDADRNWLEEIVNKSVIHSLPGEWAVALLRASQVVFAPATDSRDPAQQPQGLTPDLCAALAALGHLSLSEEGETEARLAIVNPDFRNLPVDRAAAQACALRWLMRVDATAIPKRVTVQEVSELLRGVPHALKRWPWEHQPRTQRVGGAAQRWDMQNEYHVQSLLWVILAPLLPDLEDEEYLRSLGHKHPRADLAIPSLQLILEAKYLRSGRQSDFAAIINEVSADVGLYLAPPSQFKQIVPFVWDDSRSNNQHHELLSGLRKLPGVADAVVVSRPGGWQNGA